MYSAYGLVPVSVTSALTKNINDRENKISGDLLSSIFPQGVRGRRMQGLNVEFLVPVLVRLRKKSTKGMLRNQTCKRLLNNRFV